MSLLIQVTVLFTPITTVIGSGEKELGPRSAHAPGTIWTFVNPRIVELLDTEAELVAVTVIVVVVIVVAVSSNVFVRVEVSVVVATIVVT